MKPSKHFLVGAILMGVVLAGLIGYASSAHSASESGLAAKIASRFKLNSAEVQAVLDQHHTDRIKNHEQKYLERLNQAVTEGKLSDAQKDMILAKHKELMAAKKAQHQSLMPKNPTKHRAAATQLRAEIEAWEKQNNLPSGYLVHFHRQKPLHGI